MSLSVGLKRQLLCTCVLACLLSSPAAGLVISTTNDLADTEVAAGFSYWDNIGWLGTTTAGGEGSCVYLGDSWVLTANHVSFGNVVLGGVTYAAIEGSSVRIGSADAKVFRIANPPDLAPVPIAESALTTGSLIRMFGTGLEQATNRTYWRVAGSTWTETNQGQANASGFEWASSRVKRWGTNEITSLFDSVGNYFFDASFDREATDYEAIAATHDSGGAVFLDNGGTWELAGLTVGLQSWLGQPDAGVDWVSWQPGSGNKTVMLDLTYYRDDIVNATPQPEPIPGDLNGDDFVDAGDLDIVLASWGQHVGPDDPADPNGDGFVDPGDLDVVLASWGNGTPPPGTEPLPEPTALVLLCLAAPAVLRCRGHKR